MSNGESSLLLSESCWWGTNGLSRGLIKLPVILSFQDFGIFVI